MEEEIIDLKGDVCPYPLVMAIKKVIEVEDTLKSGALSLTFIVDHPPATRSIPKEIKKRGYDVEVNKRGAGEWEIIVRKGKE
ncbi:MAG: sulfurtransferase TusA family protein [Candidatus Syntropharchaeia archaeon]